MENNSLITVELPQIDHDSSVKWTERKIGRKKDKVRQCTEISSWSQKGFC